MAYIFTLDGLAFTDKGKHARGPIVYVSKRNWVEHDVLGGDHSVWQMMGRKSQRWNLEARCNTTERDKLIEVYEGEIPVLWQTPQDATGINVLMPELEIEYREPIERGLYFCQFMLVHRP